MSAAEICTVLRAANLISGSECPTPAPLTGGVSSDIWRVDTLRGPVCVKRALAQLKTEKTWHAPIERNASEADWIRTVAKIAPHAVPEILAEARDAGMFVMEYFDPADYPVWKEQLRDGNASEEFAAVVGSTLGAIHAMTAGKAEIRERFATDHIFHPIRIEPYLLRTAEAHPDLKDRLRALADVTANTKRVLVHGDISPKNILAGPDGPVFLDAECAWYGDPAFDLAFCLNHLMLKCIWTPSAADGFLNCFAALANAYLERVDWEPGDEIELRTSALLPGLLLARIDGASPVEYITDTDDQDRVRRAARAILFEPSNTLAETGRRYREEAAI
jgi:aminoglycoside phosphotransferase (APT) family kinase protein